jgi:hypothetical protein
MYGLPEHVGKRFKCPDCGALTVLPPPPKLKAKKQPAALDEEQYEVWGPDEQPLPSDLLKSQPRYIAVTCRLCGTLMQATEGQVGKALVCPDCHTRNVVPSLKPQPANRPVAKSTIEVDTSRDPGERPAVVLPKRPTLLYEQERAEEEAKEAAKPAHKRRRTDARGRPIRPRWPLVTGVWRMLTTEEIIARWVLLSLTFGFAGQFLAEALLTPIQGMVEAIKMMFSVFGLFLAIVGPAMAGPLFVAIVGESAEGNDKLNEPPRLLAFDWFGELFIFAVPATVAGLFGMGAWKVAQMISLGPVVSAAITTAVVVTVLPVTLLSALLEGTPLGVISPRLLGSFFYGPGRWLLFYVQTFIFIALAGAVVLLLAPTLAPTGGQSMSIVWVLAPLAVAALLFEMRLLGRLAWWISDLMPEEKEPEND